MTDKALEAAARATCQSGGMDPDEIMANDGPRWRYYLPGAQAAISAYLSALPGEAEVVAWIRSDDLQEPPERRHVTAWEKVATSWAEGFHPCTPLVTLASLQAMQARAEKAERENEALIDDAQKAWAKHGGMEIAKGQWQARAEAAEARVKKLQADIMRLLSEIDNALALKGEPK